jgi:hypothetical protein
MEKTNLEIPRTKEKYSNYEDYQDYKSSQSINKFFTLKGFVKAILIFILFVVIFQISLISLVSISNSIKLLGSSLVTAIGLSLFFLERSLKKKTQLFIKKTPEYIKLSSPFYIDIVTFFSGFLFFLGSILTLYSMSSSIADFTFYISSIFSVYFVYYFFISYKKFRHSLFDVIIIRKESLLIDFPESKKSTQINKDELKKIVDLRLIKSGLLDKRIIEFYFTNETNLIELDEDHFKNMRLDIDLFINSLNEMDYQIKTEIFTFGQTYRTDENFKELTD